MTTDFAATLPASQLLEEIDALFDLLAEHEESQQLDRLDALADRFTPAAVAAVRKLLQGLARHADFFEQPAAQRVSLERIFTVGESLGRWRINGELGRGGQAIALAVSRVGGGFEQQAVLKVPLSSPPSADAVRRMLRERQLLASMKHPGLPSLIDGGVLADGAPYLVIERIIGRPIDAYADTQQLSLRDRVALLREVAHIIAYAHAQLVLHRDIKPANILIDEAGRIVLLDFGVAQSLQANATATTAGYTLSFAAPEQVRAERSTAATDVYGLAALACKLLGGQSPFGELTASAQVRAVLEREPTLPNGLDRDLQAILRRALRKEPSARYASIAEFDAELERWQGNVPVFAHAGGTRYRIGKWIRRRRVAVAVTSVLLAITSAALWQRTHAQEEAANALAVKNFVLRVFAGANRWTTGREVSALELAQRGFHEVETLDSPRAKFELYTTLAGIFGRNQPIGLAVQASDKRLALMDPIGLSKAQQLRIRLDHLYFLWWAERLPEAHAHLAEIQLRHNNELANDPQSRAHLRDIGLNLAKGEQRLVQMRTVNTRELLADRQRDMSPEEGKPSEIYYYGNRLFVAFREFNYNELADLLPEHVRAVQRYGLTNANAGLAIGTTAEMLHALSPNSETGQSADRALSWCGGYFGHDSSYCDGLNDIRLVGLAHAARWTDAESVYLQRLAFNSRFPDESIVELQPLYYIGSVIAVAAGDWAAASARSERAHLLAVKLCGDHSHCTRAARAAQLRIAGTPQAHSELRDLASVQTDQDDPQCWRSWLWLAQDAIAQQDLPTARAHLSKAGDWLRARGAPLQGDMRAVYQQLDLAAPPDSVYDTGRLLPQINRILESAETLRQEKSRLAPQTKENEGQR